MWQYGSHDGAAHRGFHYCCRGDEAFRLLAVRSRLFEHRWGRIVCRAAQPIGFTYPRLCEVRRAINREEKRFGSPNIVGRISQSRNSLYFPNFPLAGGVVDFSPAWPGPEGKGRAMYDLLVRIPSASRRGYRWGGKTASG